MSTAHFLTLGPAQMAQGDSLLLLRSLPDGCIDAVITDPPYSSGGFSRADKSMTTTEKYQNGGTSRSYPEFAGDHLDQRSYAFWATQWMSECVRVLRPGGYFLVFSDWRQLPLMTDCLQASGVFWRGIAVWDKGAGSRAPHKGYFRHQCEYIVWGTKGKIAKAVHAGSFSGCLKYPVLQSDKHHTTGKPTALMQELVQIVPAGCTVLDRCV